MRFERKYRIENMTLASVKEVLRFHPAGFSELYPDRQVNNIYFDSPELATFHQNVYGFNERKKYRVRWYGGKVEEISSPNLEIKIKHNELGEKEVFPVSDFDLNNLRPLSRAVNEQIRFQPFLQPALLNSYRRAYLMSADGKYRVTIDHALRYHSMLHGLRFHRYQITDAAIIMEVKYEQADDEGVGFITQNLPFRQDKHSKYVQGIQMTR